MNEGGDIKECSSCPVMLQFNKLYDLFKLSLVALIVISLGDKFGSLFQNFIK